VLIGPDRLPVSAERVLHVGAHEAEEADLYAGWGAEVLWVEANPTLAARLTDRGFDVVAAAAWSQAATLTLHVASNGQSSSVYPMAGHTDHYPHITTIDTIEVPAVRLDSLGWQPDFLNLDVQGAELEALKGATGILPGVRWVYTEVSAEELYAGQPLDSDVDRWLAGHGFVRDQVVWTAYGWGDALYVRM
jgi:FkbM family methyltransferase